jgi:hypothetical protein
MKLEKLKMKRLTVLANCHITGVPMCLSTCTCEETKKVTPD